MKMAKHWTEMTIEEAREDLIERLVFAGMAFSKWMRSLQTIQIQFHDPYFGASWNDLIVLTQLPGRPMVKYVDSADLHYVQAGKNEQAHWTARKWKKEILSRLEIRDELKRR